MCRLLANYVLSLITPFQVTIYRNKSRSSRSDYVNAIVRCRDHPEEGPRALASMLVVGAWCGWKELDALINKRSSAVISMVVKKSLFEGKEKEYITDKLIHIWPGLETEMTEEKVIDKVIAIVSDLDTTLLDGLKYMETKVQLEGNIYFFLHVYK